MSGSVFVGLAEALVRLTAFATFADFADIDFAAVLKSLSLSLYKILSLPQVAPVDTHLAVTLLSSLLLSNQVREWIPGER